MTRRVELEDLTVNQRVLLTNGCGAAKGPVPVPEFVFGDACDRHDFAYWRGGTKDDRLKADRRFLREMRDAAMEPLSLILALAYYQAVRLFGSKHFAYGDEKDYLDVLLHEARMDGRPYSSFGDLVEKWMQFESAA